MSEERKSNKPLNPKLPPLPNVKVPAPPQIRPEVKQGLDTLFPSLTNDEIRYAWELLKQTTKQRVAKVYEQQRANPQQQTQPIHPVLQPILDDIEKAEQYVTKGYTVQYPPKALVPLGEQNDFGALDILDMILTRLDPLFKNPKVQDQIARLIGALADKVEGTP